MSFSSLKFIEISKTDPRKYSKISLPNGIRGFIVQDVNSELAAAAVSVKTGAANDPVDYAGMAHFTEHMLFLGTEKFPVENYYKDFLNRNGGKSNAGTGMEETTYKFDVNARSFQTAVDIFSQFFKCPLFNEESSSREVRAVDSEDSKNRILDGRRFLQVMKSLIISDHRYAKFSTGNSDTLAKGDPDIEAPKTREVMSNFYKKYYRPSEMSVCFVGPQPVEELQYLMIESFKDVPIHSISADLCDGMEGNLENKFDSYAAFPFHCGGAIVR